MFVGAVPIGCVEQIVRCVPFSEWGKVWVGCSGSFRFDRAVKARHPLVEVQSNDVSLLSVGLGTLARGGAFELRFTGRLEFVNAHVKTFIDAVAAVFVALDMARHRGQNTTAKAHFGHYQQNFESFLSKARQKVGSFLEETKIDGFHAGDFRDQVERARQHGGGVVAFPPTYKGGYERLYKFLDEGTEWKRPDYRIWDPKELGAWTRELETGGVPYCVLADHELEGLRPIIRYATHTNRPIVCYAGDGRSSIKRSSLKAQAFRYKPIDAKALTKDTIPTITRAEAGHMTFLKNVYLARGISHTTGDANFLVWIGDQLVGGFIYSKDRTGRLNYLYLLSDFCISRERRLSKLVAMLATSREAVRVMERRTIIKVSRLLTTAFTDKPVSMKYRGVFELVKRAPGKLNYEAAIRDDGIAAIYRDWWERYGKA